MRLWVLFSGLFKSIPGAVSGSDLPLLPSLLPSRLGFGGPAAPLRLTSEGHVATSAKRPHMANLPRPPPRAPVLGAGPQPRWQNREAEGPLGGGARREVLG